jgi:hypothetical protein
MMTTRTGNSFAMAMAGVLMTCASAWGGMTDVGPTLSGVEIEAALTNSATKGVNQYGNPYTVWFLPGGRLDGVAGKSDEYVDAGEWWTEEDYLCRRWNTWLDGATGCFQVVITDGTIYWLDHQDRVTRQEEYTAPQ